MLLKDVLKSRALVSGCIRDPEGCCFGILRYGGRVNSS